MIYDIDFEFLPESVRHDRHPMGHGFRIVDHLTHNVYRGRMAFWAQLLREDLQLPRDPLLRHQGRVHGAHLPRDDRARRHDPHPAQRGIGQGRTGQIEEFLMKFNGEGIQHIALLTDDLIASVD